MHRKWMSLHEFSYAKFTLGIENMSNHESNSSIDCVSDAALVPIYDWELGGLVSDLGVGGMILGGVCM